jgi:hypothetical protein
MQIAALAVAKYPPCSKIFASPAAGNFYAIPARFE